jgi:hypothetical protein
MQYLLALIDEQMTAHNWEDFTPEQMAALHDQMNAYNDQMKEAGVLVHGAGLDEPASATTVRFPEGGEPVVTDGPFAETKEWLAGWWVIECHNLDQALEWTKKAPLQGGTIEVRPLITERSQLMEKVGGEAETS